MRPPGLSMSTANFDRPFPSSTPNVLKNILMNWLTLQMMIFTLGQSSVAASTSGSELIGP